uniref:hypothetical protein n=1 Tax=Cupriavidus taiwanensis TaxID=164546 RepID=UPI000E2E755E|nr:hypothetical protein [Cupriavidus taiwanensis]
MDQALGDVMLANEGVLRLLEFKRSTASVQKEVTKRQLLERALASDKSMLAISREVHWYIESEDICGSFSANAIPYLDFEMRQLPRRPMESFTEEVAAAATSSVVSSERRALYSEYLELVAFAQGGLQGASGGLIVCVNADGVLDYVVLPDLRDIVLDHRLVCEAYFDGNRQAQLQQGRARVRSLDGARSAPSFQRGRDFER